MPYLNALLILLLSLPLGMGVGSGGLFLIYLSDVLMLKRDAAVYLNLIFFLCALISSAMMHLRAKRLRFSILLTVLLFGLPGAYFGRILARLLPQLFLRLLLASFLIFSGITALCSLKKEKKEKKLPHALDK